MFLCHHLRNRQQEKGKEPELGTKDTEHKLLDWIQDTKLLLVTPHLAIRAKTFLFLSVIKITMICLCSYLIRPGPKFAQINAALNIQTYMRRVLYCILIQKKVLEQSFLCDGSFKGKTLPLAHEFTIYMRQKKKRNLLERQVYQFKDEERSLCQSVMRCRSSRCEH